MTIKKKEIAIGIAIPMAVGAVSGFLSKNGMMEYMQMPQPPLSPPSWVFPVAWTILYTLMGIASYLIYRSTNKLREMGLVLYFAQLIFNFFWSIVFFNLKNYLFALIWLVAMQCLIIVCTAVFFKIEKKAAYMLLPYIAWTFFAIYLNYNVYLMYG